MSYTKNSIEVDANGNVSSVSLDPDLAVILGDASNAAYNDFTTGSFDKTLASGSEHYDYYNRFYGLDSLPLQSGNSEKFGLIYTKRNDPSTVLIAFRGTASLEDAIKDLESISVTPFKPHKSGSSFPNNVHVGSGFFDIYTKTNSSQLKSMQQQLFDYLDALDKKHSVKHIVITGHSLGCPLGSLFALDVAVCKPTRITNINFASPRVGEGAWHGAYEKYVTNGSIAGQPENMTIRIVNSYDYVPTLPRDWWFFPFQHVGVEFHVKFTIKDSSPYPSPEHILSWHSLNNYQYVVKNAVVSGPPQGWSGTFSDAPYPTLTMVSYNPYL